MPLDPARSIPAPRRIKRAMPSSLDLLFGDLKAKSLCGLCHGTTGAHRPAQRDCHRRELRGVHDGRAAQAVVEVHLHVVLVGPGVDDATGPGLQRLAAAARRGLCDAAVNPYVPPRRRTPQRHHRRTRDLPQTARWLARSSDPPPTTRCGGDEESGPAAVEPSHRHHRRPRPRPPSRPCAACGTPARSQAASAMSGWAPSACSCRPGHRGERLRQRRRHAPDVSHRHYQPPARPRHGLTPATTPTPSATAPPSASTG